MNRENVKQRMKAFSVRIILMTEKMPQKQFTRILADQLIRSATSAYANYSASGRAKSSRDFLNKLKIVEEESDEAILWLDLLLELQVFPGSKLEPLLKEGNEILSIIVASLKTVKSNSIRK